jgi:RHS repeat-associated protein
MRKRVDRRLRAAILVAKVGKISLILAFACLSIATAAAGDVGAPRSQTRRHEVRARNLQNTVKGRFGAQALRTLSRADRVALARARRIAWVHARHASAQRRRWLEQPHQREQRAASGTEYRGLAAGAARALLQARFGAFLRGVGASPAASVAAAGHVVAYRNNYSAVVVATGGRELYETSNVPLRTDSGPVDLQLVERRNGFVAVRSAAALSLASSLAGGALVGPGVRFVLEGTDTRGALTGDNAVFYPDVAADTDASVTPTADGVDLSAVLRSPASPEVLRYRVELPEGFTLRASGGLAVVYRGPSAVLTIMAPVARDAQSTAVPVTMSVSGDELILTVPHRSLDVDYPVLVDPQVQVVWNSSWRFDSYAPSGMMSSPSAGVIVAKNTSWPAITGPGTSPYSANNVQAAWGWSASPYGLAGALPVTTRVEWDNVSLANTLTSSPFWAELFVNGPGVNSKPCQSPNETDSYGTYFGPTPPSTYVVSGSTTCGTSILVDLAASGAHPAFTGGATLSVGAVLVTEQDAPPVATPSEYFGGNDPGDPGQVRACAGDPVDCATGNFSESHTDLSLKGRGLPFALARTYNAQSAAAGANGPFGSGWSSSFSDHLVINSSAGTIAVVQANGSQVPFLAATGMQTPIDPLTQATLFQNSDGTYTYSLPNQEAEQFSAGGVLLSESDRYGNRLTCAYDSSGRLTTITDSAGRSITLAYAQNGSGDVTSATGPMGTVAYAYDASGNLTQVTDLDGGIWQFGYDSSYRITTMTDPDGRQTSNAYDAENRVTAQTDGDNRTTTWSYPAAGQTVITHPGADVTDETFNANYQPTSITRAAGTSSATTEALAYDDSLNLVQVTDGNGQSVSYGYNYSGDRTSETDGSGRNTTYSTYDGTHDVTSTTDPLGHITTFTYTGLEPTSVSRTQTETGKVQTTTYGYDAQGDLASVTDPLTNKTTYGYDAAGDRTSMTAPGGERTTWGYDGSGYLTSMVSPAGNKAGANPASYTTTRTNDAYGRPTAITDPLAHTTRSVYDGDGNTASVTGPDGKKTTYTSDNAGQLTTTTRPGGSTLTDGYDADGRLISQTDGAGKTTVYAYDPAGNVSSVSDPLNRETSYGYDLAGNVTSTTDPTGRTTTYGHDPENQMVSISYSDAKTPGVTYAYSADGRRTSMVDGTGTTSYSYDSLGRLTGVINGDKQTVGYGYDLDNDETSITYPNGKAIARAFDTDGRLSSITDWSGNKTAFAYGPDSQLQTTTLPATTSNIDNYGYNTADQLTSIAMATGSTMLASLSYTRDAAGQLASVTPTGVGQSNESYTYTPINQLATVNSSTYSYDTADNLSQLTSGQTQSYDAANELTSITTAGQSPAYTYDTLGERTQGAIPTLASSTYAYNQAQQLTSVTPSVAGASLSGGDAYSLAVNAAGQVEAWGTNTHGQLGTGNTTASSTPVAVSNLTGISSVAAGSSHSLALKGDGTVWAWGYNNDGQLGNNTTTNSSTPAQVSTLSKMTAVSAAPGGYHSVALKSDGTVWAWGLNSSGQLGNNSTTTAKTPVQVNDLTGAIAVAAGASDSLAIKSDSTVWAWGLNSSSQLGNNSTTNATTPVQVSGLTGVIAIASGTSHSLALKSDGTVWAWGANTYGQVGNGTTTSSKVPVQVKNLTGVIAIAAGANHSLALESNGTAWAWGYNNDGQLGTGNTTNSTTPVQVKSLTAVAAIGSGGSHSLYAASTGAPWAVGLNTSGQLGNGTTINASTAVQTSNLAGVRALGPAIYTYDGNGLRASSTTARITQHYAWDQTAINPLLLTDGSTSYIHGPGDLPVEQITSSGTISYYHHDQLGSTRLLTGSAGATTATYSYNAYGQLTGQTGTSNTPLRWAGQYQDASTGLYYLRARYFDPTTGQFLTRDPLDAFTRQTYSYAADNPLSNTDPSGQCDINPLGSDSCIGDAIDGVASGAEAAGSAVASVAPIAAPVLDALAGGACVVASEGACIPILLGNAVGAQQFLIADQLGFRPGYSVKDAVAGETALAAGYGLGGASLAAVGESYTGLAADQFGAKVLVGSALAAPSLLLDGIDLGQATASSLSCGA